jgi:hypothetical protein
MNRDPLFQHFAVHPSSRGPSRNPIRSSTRFRALDALLLFVCAFCAPLIAQTAPPDLATVTFTLDFPASDPPRYSIAVDANGHANYDCAVKIEDDPDQQTYHSEFQVTATTRQRIFDWTKQANYFSGKVDSGNRKLAFTGNKSLTYHDGQRLFSAQYNFSNLDPARQLTSLFQNIAATQDFGRRLAYYHRYQKLALDEELKRMETQAKSNQISEIHGVAAVLQAIADDPSVINVVRARARELIEIGNRAAAAP